MKKKGVKRLFLHAEKLSFTWESGEKVNFVAKIDDGFGEIIMRFIHR